MAGIYFHIPFCKQACHYCDFHFSTSLRFKTEMLQAMQREIFLRKDYLGNETVETIYFGGGTPSILAVEEIKALLESIHQYFSVSAEPEITLEANPDDLTPEKCAALYQAGINRLSIGIQSFNDKHLTLMNRAHNAEMALNCAQNARKNGIQNLSIDLMYGLPALSQEDWEENLRIALSLNPEHISAYNLTVEPKTALFHQVKKGLVQIPSDAESAKQFDTLCETLKQAGYRHYEISNFCKPGFISRHNSSYWQDVKYLGIGPSAHSYNHTSRQWNVAHNVNYIQAIRQDDELSYELEETTLESAFNEYLLTGLRTDWGINLNYIKARFGFDFQKKFRPKMVNLIAAEKAVLQNDTLILTEKGFLFADKIASDFFILS
ncbi:MAG: radical SAM family heme chaperone HemW [Luteibaculaceae bacterium]